MRTYSVCVWEGGGDILEMHKIRMWVCVCVCDGGDILEMHKILVLCIKLHFYLIGMYIIP